MKIAARYGSYYVKLVSSLETNYPGLKDQLSKTGLLIKYQVRYTHRIHIDIFVKRLSDIFQPFPSVANVLWNLELPWSILRHLAFPFL